MIVKAMPTDQRRRPSNPARTRELLQRAPKPLGGRIGKKRDYKLKKPERIKPISRLCAYFPLTEYRKALVAVSFKAGSSVVVSPPGWPLRKSEFSASAIAFLKKHGRVHDAKVTARQGITAPFVYMDPDSPKSPSRLPAFLPGEQAAWLDGDCLVTVIGLIVRDTGAENLLWSYEVQRLGDFHVVPERKIVTQKEFSLRKGYLPKP